MRKGSGMMVRITVCFKIVPDYEEIPVPDWQKGQIPDTTFCKKMYGCFDEAALETGLRLKDALTAAGREVCMTAVTVGTGQAALLTGLYAAGYDRVVCITEELQRPASCPGPEGTEARQMSHSGPEGTEARQMSHSGPEAIALQLAAYLRQEPADLILTGRQVGGWDSGTVPAYLAAALSLPWLPEVVSLAPEAMPPVSEQAERPTFVADCEGETCWEKIRVSAPAVLSVGNAEASYLRMFSLKARLEAKKKAVMSWNPKDDAEGRELSVTYCSRQKATRCAMLEGSAEEQAKALYQLVREGRDGA